MGFTMAVTADAAPSYGTTEQGEPPGDAGRARAIISAITNLCCGLLFFVISLPLVLRMVPMNGLYGFRTSKAFMSDELWYDINAYGAKQLILASLGMIAAGVGCFFLENALENPIAGLVASVGPLCLFSAIALVRTLLYTAKLPSPPQ